MSAITDLREVGVTADAEARTVEGEQIISALPESFWDRVEIGPGCWNWTGALSGGSEREDQQYGYFTIWNDGQRKTWRAHRLMWIVVNGPIPAGLCVLHRCNSSRCVNPDHLYLGDHKDNAKDRKEAGHERPQYGGLNFAAKLTDEQVIEMRRLWAEGESGVALSRRFEISRANVSLIVNGLAWRHLPLAG